MKRTLTRYIFSGPDWSGQPCEIRSYGDTPEIAKSHISRSELFTLVSSEEIPYKYADLAHAIAAALPGKWQASPISEEYADCSWQITRDDGLEIWTAGPCYNHKNAFRFAASLPRHEGRYVEAYEPNSYTRIATPSIKCGEAKSAEQMAKDITRRLLEDAERVTNIVRERIAAMISEADKREASLVAMCKALNRPVPAMNERYPEYRYKQSLPDGSFEVHSGGGVSFTFYSMDIEKAVKLAKAQS